MIGSDWRWHLQAEVKFGEILAMCDFSFVLFLGLYNVLVKPMD